MPNPAEHRESRRGELLGRTRASRRAREGLQRRAAALLLGIVSLSLVPSRLSADEPAKPRDFHVTEAGAASGGKVVQLRETMQVTLDDLDGYLAVAGKAPEELVLFIGSRPIVGLPARRIATSGDAKNVLLFDLRSLGGPDPKQSNRESWAGLVGSPSLSLDEKRTYLVTVGTEGRPLASDARVEFIVVSRFWGVIGWGIVLALSGGLGVLVVKSDVLRDPGPPPVNAQNQPLVKAFSLARVQFATWLWIIIASYVFIWVLIGETASLTGQVLGILGINSATLVGSVVVDNRQRNLTPAAPQTRDPAAPPPAPLAASASDSFFVDILSDKTGISLDRFQSLAWTVVMVVVFVTDVWRSLAMPEFNEYLLALMGLSSGTYVTMKANS